MKSSIIDDDCLIINKEYFENIKDFITCIICLELVIDPRQCPQCQNCFCNLCYIKSNKQNCPYKCKETKFYIPRMITALISKLLFKCKTSTCENLIKYNEYSNTKLCAKCYHKIDLNENLIKEIKKSLIDKETEIANLKNIIENQKANIDDLEDQLDVENKEIEKLNRIIQNQRVQLQERNESNNENASDCESSYESEECPNSNSNTQIIFLKFPNHFKKIRCGHVISSMILQFVCCNKVYPCRDCHNENEDHQFKVNKEIIVCKNCRGCNYKGVKKCLNCEKVIFLKKS